MKKKAPLFSFKYLLHDIVKWFGSWQLLLFYRLKISYDGVESKKKHWGGAIIISNHVGYSDPFIMQCMFPYRRFFFLAADILFKKKIVAWIYKNIFLTQPIYRDKPVLQTVKYAAEVAKRGNFMCIFPEGHIYKEQGKVDTFKGGAVLMAYMAGVPIIPCYHEKRKSIWNRTRVAIGKPFDIKEMVGPVPSQDKINEVAQKIGEYENHLIELVEADKKRK